MLERMQRTLCKDLTRTLLFAILLAAPADAWAQSAKDIAEANRHVVQLFKQGRYKEALCAVARLTGAGTDAVYLGANATEAKVKSLSAQGALAKVRVVHFATHGLVAGGTQHIARTSKLSPRYS